MPSYNKCDSKICGNCIHFRQHYIKVGENYYNPISYGHCVFPRRKRREAEDTCPHWKAIPKDEE